MNKEIYKGVKTEAKLAITVAKMSAFEHMYFELGDRSGDN